MSESTYDIVILGAGSGGYATALRAAQLGMKVALIDGDKVGGTCLHRGCIPTKAYLHAAETAEAVREAAKFGVSSTFNGIDMAQVGKYRDSVISGLYKGLQGLLKSRNVEVISGLGRLADANTIEVNGQRITGRNIVLATGSYSRSIPGLDIGGRVISRSLRPCPTSPTTRTRPSPSSSSAPTVSAASSSTRTPASPRPRRTSRACTSRPKTARPSTPMSFWSPSAVAP